MKIAQFSRNAFNPLVVAVTPFGLPDEKLLVEFSKSAAWPVLDIGSVWDVHIEKVLDRLIQQCHRPFAIRVGFSLQLPSDFQSRYAGHIQGVIFSQLADLQTNQSAVQGLVKVCEVVSLDEALLADQAGARGEVDGLIVKGSEAGGRVGDAASFIFMQQVAGKLSLPYWVQGGMGPFGAVAAVYAGARGVVYDSQFALMGKFSKHQTITPIIKSLNGSETEVVANHRYLRHGLLKNLKGCASSADVLKVTTTPDGDKCLLLAGMDIALAQSFAKIYHDPQTLIHLTVLAIEGRIQRLTQNHFQANSSFAQGLGIEYPIIQGPMTRVSDEAKFAAAVAQEGALPTIACAVLRPETLDRILGETALAVGEKPWAAGILAFLPPEVLKPQLDVILKHKPSAVVLAGGRTDQCKFFAEKGMTPIVHCPTEKLFQQFMKEGVTHFIFEGRECGGHIGPLSSMTLWEIQITNAMEYAQPEQLHLTFAGGIHDPLSVQMLSAMVQPLAQKGVNVGVLVGTAYIFCEEAVTSGAILKNYQEQAVRGTETAVVETGIGHVTRCLKTGYVDYLAKQRQQMEQQGLSKEEIFIELEKLNVGHLRLATKGTKREGDKLVEVSLEEQNSQGMFMIGDVALLRDKVTTLRELHAGLTAPELSPALLTAAQTRLDSEAHTPASSCDIAIVGMAAQFAGSQTIDEYWLNILEGRDLVTEVDDSRWPKSLFFDPNSTAAENEKTYSKWGAFIDAFALDPTEFGIPPQTLCSIDAGQLAALRVTKDALVDAGYQDADRLHKTSVIFGYEPGGEIAGAYGLRIMMNQIAVHHPDLLEQARQRLPRLNEDSFAGILGNVLAGRVTNRLNMGGQNFTIDAACASSLAAIDAAVKELRYGESDMVVAGGIDFHNGIQDYIMFCSTYALSRKGKCFSFSDEADGIALGEGMAAVVLKRLEDAEADGDQIYGVIKGIAGSSDGKSLGLTAPRREGQKTALQRAYQRAGISPRKIGLVEAHGTGTVVGDRTEMTALEEVYQWAGVAPGDVALGTVKTQIGHTKCAAGVASLIKAALATRYGVLPPTLNIQRPNKQYREGVSPFNLNHRALPWLQTERMAGVSSFGFGGTNYHAVVASATESTHVATPNLRSHELFLWRGATQQTALQQVQQLLDFVQQSNMRLSLANLSYSVHAVQDPQLPVQVALVCSDIADLKTKLSQALAGQSSLNGVLLNTSANAVNVDAPALAFLFAGQGSQYVDMGRELFNYFPELRQYLHLAGELAALWFPNTVFDDESRQAQLAAITQTQVTQPLLGLLSHAVVHLLQACGVQAGVAAGHSYGELAAVAYAGGLEMNALVDTSRARAQAIVQHSQVPCGMLAVACEATRAERLLSDANIANLNVANLNSPQQTILTGTVEAIAAVQALCNQHQIKSTRINTPYAFHSPLIAGAEASFAQALSTLKPLDKAVTVWSNLTAQPYPSTTTEMRAQLAKQIVSPVQYQQMIEGMYAQGVKVFVEVGSGAIQTQFVKDILAQKDDVVAISTLQKNQSALRSVLLAMGQMAMAGVALDASYLYAQRKLSRYDLSQPLQYKRSTWLVNGQYARPLVGDMPKNGYLPSQVATVYIPPSDGNNGTTQPETVYASSSRDHIMSHYLQTLNHFVDQQKQIMLQYLGAPAAVSTVSNMVPMPAMPSISAPVAVPAQVAMTQASPVQTVSAQVAKPQITQAQILQQVIAGIADKTGYPTEMIEPQLDLESDLGIDSIKRMELLASLAENLGMPLDAQSAGEGQDTTELLKEVAALKSAEQIAQWMFGVVQSAPTTSANSQPATQSVAMIAAPMAQATVAQPAYTVDVILAKVIAGIAEKTGYPTEMIEPQLDLESDLGIDSIKRMELLASLAESLGMPLDAQSMGEGQDTTELLKEVAALKSAEQIAQWMFALLKAKGASSASEATEQIAHAVTTPVVSTQAVVSAPLAQTTAVLSVAEITEKVVSGIAEKTGYPPEMIEPQLDLESDLGIDSIKRMELLASLAESLGMPLDAQNMSDSQDSTELLKEVAALKSAEQIARWMHQLLTQKLTPANHTPESATATTTAAPAQNKVMVRYETAYLPCELTATRQVDLGVRVLVIAETPVPAFCEALSAQGSKTRQVTRQVQQASMQALDSQVLSGQESIILVLDNAHQTAIAPERFYALVALVKQLPLAALRHFVVIAHSDYVQRHGVYVRPLECMGVSGFIAALRRELPKVSIANLYVHDASAEMWVNQMMTELAIDADEGEAYLYRPAAYLGAERYRRSLIEVPFELSTTPVVKADDVIVIVGGAKGITQWTAVEVAKQYGCHIVLLGRSALDANDIAQLEVKSADQLRRQLIAENSGKMPLGQIEALISKTVNRHQLVAGIRELQASAKSVQYYSVDTNQAEAVSQVITDVVKKYGKIDGCIYGAGMIRDKFLQDKSLSDVEVVYAVKTTGYFNFVQAVMQQAQPRFVIAYSSISAILGSRGQTDYGAANEALEHCSDVLAAQYPATRFASIGWGPWTGIGMVDAALEEHLARYEIFAIERHEGAQFLVQEIQSNALGNRRAFAFKKLRQA